MSPSFGTAIGRRRFLSRTMAALGVAGALRPARGPAASQTPGRADMIPIIDTHQHLWDLSLFRLPWHGENPRMARSFVMRDYLEATAGLNVVKSVYMEVDVEPSQQPA